MRRLSQAELLLHELGVSEPGDIDVEAIAYYCGAAVRYRPLDGCEAQIIGYDDRAVIIVREDSHPRRKRYSIGHELGHWRYHRGRSKICRPDQIDAHLWSPSDPERVADTYAADLLLPAYLFEPLLDQLGDASMAIVRQLADTFDTSLRATAIRLVELSPQPTVVVCYGAAGRKWFVAGKTVPAYWYLSRNLDPDSFAYDCLKGRDQPAHSSLMPADAWFDGHGAGRFELREYSLRVGHDEVLTLLVLPDEMT